MRQAADRIHRLTSAVRATTGDGLAVWRRKRWCIGMEPLADGATRGS